MIDAATHYSKTLKLHTKTFIASILFYLHRMKNLRLLMALVLLLSCSFSHAQYDVSKINKKAVKAYTRAMQQAQEEKYQDAIAALQEALQKDAGYIDAYL